MSNSPKNVETSLKGKFLLIILYILSDEYKGELRNSLKILEFFLNKLKEMNFKSPEMQGFYESIYKRLEVLD